MFDKNRISVWFDVLNSESRNPIGTDRVPSQCWMKDKNNSDRKRRTVCCVLTRRITWNVWKLNGNHLEIIQMWLFSVNSQFSSHNISLSFSSIVSSSEETLFWCVCNLFFLIKRFLSSAVFVVFVVLFINLARSGQIVQKGLCLSHTQSIQIEHKLISQYATKSSNRSICQYVAGNFNSYRLSGGFHVSFCVIFRIINCSRCKFIHWLCDSIFQFTYFFSSRYLEKGTPFKRKIHQDELWMYKNPRTDSYVPSQVLWPFVLAVPCTLFFGHFLITRNKLEFIQVNLSFSLAVGLNGIITNLLKLVVGKWYTYSFHFCFIFINNWVLL